MAEQLRKTQARGTGTEHEHAGSELGGNLLQAVAGARGRLQEGSINVGQVLELEDLPGGVGAVLGETTVHWTSH